MPGIARRFFEIEAHTRDALRPPPLEPLSTWLEGHLRLPQGLSAVGGPLTLWPTQRGIADALADPELERVTLVKSARSGFTTLLTGLIAHHVVNDPASVLCVLPTDSDCRDYVATDIEPIFAASPDLRGVLGEPGKSDAGRNTIVHRMGEGWSLKVVAAKAPRNLRRHAARILLVDEADACEAGAEGSPIHLAEKRTLSFANRKIIIGSTPLDEDTSHVLRSYALSDQRVFEVPCPECGAFTEITWQHIEFDPLGFRCPNCESLISDDHKLELVAAGRWHVTKPEVKGHAGFKLNALVSMLPNASWSKLVAEFLTAKDDADQLRVFVNTVLAEGWRSEGEETNEDELRARAEPFSLACMPTEVLCLTCGVDLAVDRLEATTCGWTKTGELLILDHRVMWGAPDEPEPWAELDDHLTSRWKHPAGGTMRIDATVIDSGYATDAAYRFCFPRLRSRVFAGKGKEGPRPAIAIGKAKGGRLAIVGVDSIKATLFSRLARGRSIRFSDSLEERFYTELTSERRITRMSRGVPRARFERITGRNAECLDTTVYNFAARAALRLDLDQREAEIASVIPPAPRPPRVARSSFMQRGRAL